MMHSDADEPTRDGYCVLRSRFDPTLIQTRRIALWPTLVVYVERNEPNRGSSLVKWTRRWEVDIVPRNAWSESPNPERLSTAVL